MLTAKMTAICLKSKICSFTMMVVFCVVGIVLVKTRGRDQSTPDVPWHILIIRANYLTQGSHISGLTNFPDFSSIFTIFPVFIPMF